MHSRHSFEAAGEATLPGSRLPFRGLIHLFIIYIVWGSTYLAIRVAVRDGTGFPPLALGAARALPAGLILLLAARLRHDRIRPAGKEWKTLILSSLFMWVGAMGIVNWAEQRIDSGLTALIGGSLPLHVAIMEAILDRRAPSWRLAGGLIVGFVGLGFLTVPVIKVGDSANIFALILLLLGPILWGIGSVIMARGTLNLSVIAISGWQQLLATVGFVAISLCMRESFPNPSTGAFLAYLYLLAAGSLIAFTSYMAALRLLPTSLVMTYAYVNPLVAVFLGWWLVGESITIMTIVGTVLIMLGIYFVFQDRNRQEVLSS